MTIIARALVASLLLAAASAAAQGIAFVTNLKGDVAIDGHPRPLLLSELVRGQKITVGRDSHVWIMYITTGKEYLLRAPGEYHVKDTEVASAIGVPPMARTTDWRASHKVLAQVAKASAAGGRTRSLATPKPDVSPGLLFPVHGKVSTLSPVFRWRAGSTATAEILVSAPGQEKPVHSAQSVSSGYRLPARLKPDSDYLWRVSVGGQDIGSGAFRTLTAELLQQVEKQRPSRRAEFSDRVLYAMYLQELGAVQEAQEVWSRLAEERADLPELAALAR